MTVAFADRQCSRALARATALRSQELIARTSFCGPLPARQLRSMTAAVLAVGRDPEWRLLGFGALGRERLPPAQ
jgi:hypothetical protein